MSAQAIDPTRSGGERGGGGLQKLGPHIGKDTGRDFSEEKKDSSPIRKAAPGAGSSANTVGSIGETLLDQEGIPEELRGRQFQDIDALHDELDLIGQPDYKFLLNDDGYVIMPGPEHNRATRYIREELDGYRKGWLSGFWGFCDQDNVQEINKTTPSGKTAKREPDVNFWSYKRCTKVRGRFMVQRRSGSTFDVDPDVFFQFSWGNSQAYEFSAINDLLSKGGVGVGNKGPGVGFLIKMRKIGEDAPGLDVYKVYSGFSVDDAIAGVNCCEHFYYSASGNHDVVIEISPKDLGFDGIWALLCPNFKLSLADLWLYVVG